MDPLGMVAAMGVLALVLVVAFVIAWKRDQDRSQAVADDVERIEPDPSVPGDPAEGR